MYGIKTAEGILDEIFSWPDNLAFDPEGNLWITQDGGNYHVWVCGKNHTWDHPVIKVFANSPYGGEPTGITFTPDGKYMFMSVQHPWGSNNVSVSDAAGDLVVFNNHISFVVARKEFLGNGNPGGVIPPGVCLDITAVYNDGGETSAIISSCQSLTCTADVLDIFGRVLSSKECHLDEGGNYIPIEPSLSYGVYFLRVYGQGYYDLKKFAR